MKICAKCQYSSDGVWYERKCSAPDVQAQKLMNPVTGEMQHGRIDARGARFFTNEPRPYCRNVNVDGMCKHFRSVTLALVSEGS